MFYIKHTYDFKLLNYIVILLIHLIYFPGSRTPRDDIPCQLSHGATLRSSYSTCVQVPDWSCDHWWEHLYADVDSVRMVT